jgi:hypothetical protein
MFFPTLNETRFCSLAIRSSKLAAELMKAFHHHRDPLAAADARRRQPVRFSIVARDN